jgi:hypothetical protein
VSFKKIKAAHEAAKPKYQSSRCGHCNDHCHASANNSPDAFCQTVRDMDELIRLLDACVPYIEYGASGGMSLGGIYAIDILEKLTEE